MKNHDVVENFLQGMQGKTTHLYTDRNDLINYSTVIARKEGKTVLLNSEHYSQTTSTITNDIRRTASKYNLNIKEVSEKDLN